MWQWDDINYETCAWVDLSHRPSDQKYKTLKVHVRHISIITCVIHLRTDESDEAGDEENIKIAEVPIALYMEW